MPLTGTLLRGTRFGLAFSTDAYDLETTPFTVIARGPDDGINPVADVEWNWRPGGTSDPTFTWDDANSKLLWQLSSAWTATGFTVGKWQLYFLVSDPATVQDELEEMTLTVRDGRGNQPMPTA